MSLGRWLVFLVALAFTSRAGAEDPDPPPRFSGPFVELAQPHVSRPLRSLPIAAPEDKSEQADLRERPPRIQLKPGWDDFAAERDPLAFSAVTNPGRTPAPSVTFAGQGNSCGCSPPDTIGAAGPNHYVQMVNATKLTVYNKAGGVILGPVDFRSLWPSGGCSTSSNGDPIALYDTLAGRWLLAQFSSGNGVCVAVSQSNDPTGSYNLYEFSTPSFPDYFKIGAWSDAYYLGANETSYSAIALDRAKMLAGLAAAAIRFSGQTNFLMPATVLGAAAPPAGTPGIFYTFKDDSAHGGSDRLEFFHLAANFANPASSTFTLASSVNVSSFTYTVCGFFALNCIPQGGTAQKLDAVSEWPMWQLQYRNRGGAAGERLVANFTVDVGADRAGIRWFELAKTGATTYSIVQQGTHTSPDTTHRWMGSIAMDRTGSIALGYNASSSTTFPSLRFATRLPSDTLGTLQAEALLFAGNGSQTGGNRWGDYSALTVDPRDDCTFWYTGEYFTSSSASGWATRIGSFVLPQCLNDLIFEDGF